MGQRFKHVSTSGAQARSILKSLRFKHSSQGRPKEDTPHPPKETPASHLPPARTDIPLDHEPRGKRPGIARWRCGWRCRLRGHPRGCYGSESVLDFQKRATSVEKGNQKGMQGETKGKPNGSQMETTSCRCGVLPS